MGEKYTNTIIEGIKEANLYQIPTVVMHISSGNFPPKINPIALKRIKKILEVANINKVNLALENLRRLDYLDYIFDNIDDERRLFDGFFKKYE